MKWRPLVTVSFFWFQTRYIEDLPRTPGLQCAFTQRCISKESAKPVFAALRQPVRDPRVLELAPHPQPQPSRCMGSAVACHFGDNWSAALWLRGSSRVASARLRTVADWVKGWARGDTSIAASTRRHSRFLQCTLKGCCTRFKTQGAKDREPYWSLSRLQFGKWRWNKGRLLLNIWRKNRRHSWVDTFGVKSANLIRTSRRAGCMSEFMCLRRPVTRL